MGDFKIQLGRSGNLGLQDLDDRLASIQPGQNPYVPGFSLAGNSPVFFGRVQVLHDVLSTLRRPGKPGCVSLLGERRIGKSSLLNQVYQALGAEEGLVSIYATTQNWSQGNQERFFTQLQRAIAETVGKTVSTPAQDYSDFLDFILALVRDRSYRFVLILDEFEKMAGNPNFNGNFFSNMRALGEQSDACFGYLISSRRPLKELCRSSKIDESSFWNIFGKREVLGLLSEPEARDLLIKPLQKSLPSAQQFNLDQLWREDIAPLTGCHPALIQIVADQYWNAGDGNYRPDSLNVVMGIREYLEDFWYQRSQEELGLLIRAAANRELCFSPVVADLVLRGLLTHDRKPFSNVFGEVIAECLPQGKGLLEAVDDLEKGAEHANKLFEQLVKLAESAGKIYAAFKDH